MSTLTIRRRFRLVDGFGLTGLGFVVTGVAGFLLFVTVVMVSVVGLSRHFGRIACGNWSSETGYPTKFVLLNTASTGTCLARTPSGRWVVNSKVIAIAPSRKR